jgi:hypothetical protein
LYENVLKSHGELDSAAVIFYSRSEKIQRSYRLKRTDYVNYYVSILNSSNFLTQRKLHSIRNDLLFLLSKLEFPKMRFYLAKCHEAILKTFDRESCLIALIPNHALRQLMIDSMLMSLSDVLAASKKLGSSNDLVRSLQNFDIEALEKLSDHGKHTSFFWLV